MIIFDENFQIQYYIFIQIAFMKKIPPPPFYFILLFLLNYLFNFIFFIFCIFSYKRINGFLLTCFPKEHSIFILKTSLGDSDLLPKKGDRRSPTVYDLQRVLSQNYKYLFTSWKTRDQRAGSFSPNHRNGKSTTIQQTVNFLL